ncbi:MAG TPA: HAD family hydrolase [Dehalococcoidia bacterium]|nr:HAD family hydrolase [Dehalococcoidia bacterium]
MSSTRPQVALFDLDGTLVNSMPSIAAAFVQTVADFGHTTATEAMLAAAGPSMTLLIQHLTGVDEEESEAIYEAYLKVYYGEFLTQAPPLDGAEALLDRLAASDVAMAIVTSKREDGAHSLLAHLGWSDRFPVVVGRETAAAMKPAADPALYALDRLDRATGEAAFIGDTGEDMRCCRAAGIPTVVGLTMIRSGKQLRDAGATHIAGSLGQVAEVLLPIGTAT